MPGRTVVHERTHWMCFLMFDYKLFILFNCTGLFDQLFNRAHQKCYHPERTAGQTWAKSKFLGSVGRKVCWSIAL